MSTTDLVIGGMTCASCATRIERKLNRLDGVTAAVNLATETAQVSFPDALTVADLIATVQRTGYTAALPATRSAIANANAGADAGADANANVGANADAGVNTDAGPGNGRLPRRLVGALALAVPVAVLTMIPALEFPGWQWVSLALATPVVTWGAWPFHRAAAVNARHGAATMDTLVSLGVSAAYLWSLYAVLSTGTSSKTSPHASYLDVAASVTALILLGRHLEARAKRTAGTALRSLLDLGAKQVTVLRDSREERVPAERLGVGDEFIVRPGEKIAADGTVIASCGCAGSRVRFAACRRWSTTTSTASTS
jgi:Cu+-exporting ATPase